MRMGCWSLGGVMKSGRTSLLPESRLAQYFLLERVQQSHFGSRFEN